MRDLSSVVQECKTELEAIGIKCGRIESMEVNYRAKRRWGQCRTVTKGHYAISVSYRLMDESVPLVHLKNTVIHELLHTCPGCMKHTGKWLLLANKVNAAYPQYNIKRTTSSEEKGLERIEVNRNEVIRYRFQCMSCGAFYERKRASKFTRNPERYRCGRCNGKIKEI